MVDSNQIDFQRHGILQAKKSAPASLLSQLRTEYQKTLNSKQRMHYNQLAGLHNPWGKSAHLFNSWALLDICQSDAILELITPLIGPDIILWESAFYGYSALNRNNKWTRHSDFSPIEPMQGIVVRIGIDHSGVELDYFPGSHVAKELDCSASSQAESLQLKAGSIVCHDIRLAHRYSEPKNTLHCGEYVIHYMPATSLFVRDPTSTIQRHLAETLPLINYSKSPIWLVQGNDHRNNDFVTGFSPPVGQWTNAKW